MHLIKFLEIQKNNISEGHKSAKIENYIQGGPLVTPRSVEPKLVDSVKICFQSKMYMRKNNNLKII